MQNNNFLEKETDYQEWPKARVANWENRRVGIAVLCGICMLLGAAVASAYLLRDRLFEVSHVSSSVDVHQTGTIVAAVGKLMTLPEDEVPVIAAVTDASTLSAQQPFFEKVANGDVLLIYAKNLKAVIYSPEHNRIVNSGPIETSSAAAAIPGTDVIDEGTSADTGTEADGILADDTYSLYILNGTHIPSLANNISDEIEKIYGQSFNPMITGNAIESEYTETLVWAKDGVSDSVLDRLIETLDAQRVPNLPENEKDMGADIVVILGGD